jgi:RNA polymerase sigma-70 factor (ECF subfamily)
MKVFTTTLWSVVLRAGGDESATARAALAELCETYWYPLYSFVRRRGYGPDDAEDLTQSFFASLLENAVLKRADRDRGRFRTYLLAALKNFLANEWDKQRAAKRGGRHVITSLDQASAESRFRLEPSYEAAPERHFERQWALAMLDQSLLSLRDEYAAQGKTTLFEDLRGVITGGAAPYAEIALRHKMSEAAVKVAAHRLRRRYREILRLRIAQTVEEDEVDDEVRQLLAALAD